MENTPLELYETAYRLHYVENRISEALKFYEALIKEFPDSNECGYAAIQLQKIKSNEIAKALRRRSGLHPVAILALLLSIISFVLVSGIATFTYFKVLPENERASKAIKAFGMISRGEEEEALKVLSELKYMVKDDIMPFEMSADIYRRLGQFAQARAEYQIFFNLNPTRQPTPSEAAIMRSDEAAIQSISSQNETQEVAETKKTAVDRQVAVDAPPAVVTPPQTKIPISKSKARKAQPKAEPGNLLVNPDSISYF